jgi:transposase InsO family protein
MLDIIDQIRIKTEMPYQAICGAVRIPYPSYIRWCTRRKRRDAVVRQPGPCKVGLPDFSRLNQEIMSLRHGKKRSHGTGELYTRYASELSRRDLRKLVEMARYDLNEYHVQNERRLEWLVPNTCWAIDITEHCHTGGKVYYSQMQDLASRYKFNPMGGKIPCGEEVAGYIANTIHRFGAPLFLKRDNGGNLNHGAVDEVLAEHFIIPINSPPYYPPYNGAIEEAQTELKCGLDEKLRFRPACAHEHLEMYAATVENDLNHKSRPCLEGRNSCLVYFTGKWSFSKWKRRDAYEWITNLQNDILCGTMNVLPDAAWRIAVEKWLLKNEMIRVTINGKVSPYFL